MPESGEDLARHNNGQAPGRGNVQAQQDTLEFTRARFNAGLTSELDMAQAAAQLVTMQLQIPPLETSLKQGMHRLGCSWARSRVRC
jgi:hypothetical protein